MINLPIIKHCPNCGNTISESDIEFCTECGHNLSKKPIINDSKRFFDILAEKTNLSIIIFSFIIFGVLLFLGSIFWSSFVSDASIDLITYLILCVVIPVFVVGIFIGYFGVILVVPHIYMYSYTYRLWNFITPYKAMPIYFYIGYTLIFVGMYITNYIVGINMTKKLNQVINSK